MKQFFLMMALCFIIGTGVQSQTKVFKEVSSEISSEMKPIIQDGVLVGYLVATQLEKADKDSFNYKVTIMDENLNNIGEVNFREQWLRLLDVSLEQDVLCLAYVKSDFFGRDYKKKKEKRTALREGNVSILSQFVNLEGKILNAQTIKAEVNLPMLQQNVAYGLRTYQGLTHQLQMRNIPGTGFVCFFGDERRKLLVAYDTNGKQLWQKVVNDTEATSFNLLTTPSEVYLLKKERNRQVPAGGYELLSYSAKEGKNFSPFQLTDKDGRALNVIGFDNDPVTGKPYLTGYIIHDRKGRKGHSHRRVVHGTYVGVFTLNVEEPGRKGVKPVYSYWNEGASSEFTSKGRHIASKSYPSLVMASKDFQGNTVFTGYAIKRKFRYGGMLTSIALLPFAYGFLLLPTLGTHKYICTDGILLKQTPKGSLSYEDHIKNTAADKKDKKASVFGNYGQDFYAIANPETKTSFVVMRDEKNSYIYDVNKKKVIRTIPKKDGNLRTAIFPAKEGHIMVSEYDAKNRETRLSIEAV